MVQNSSPITDFISYESIDSSTESDSSSIAAVIPDQDADSSTESDSSGAEWWWPQNQLGLEADRFGFQRDEQVVALDKKGEFKHHEVIAIY
jgi:hypothetical protein